MGHRTNDERAKALAPRRTMVESTTLPAARARGAVSRLKVESVPDIEPVIEDEVPIEEEPVVSSEPRPPAISATVLVDRTPEPSDAGEPEPSREIVAAEPAVIPFAQRAEPAPIAVASRAAPAPIAVASRAEPIAVASRAEPIAAPMPPPSPAPMRIVEDTSLADDDLEMALDGARRRRRGIIVVAVFVIVVLGGFIGMLAWSHIA